MISTLTMTIAKPRSSSVRRLVPWLSWAAILLTAPLVFHQGASLSNLSLIGTVMIFGLSYNMMLGQGGMLSFGHSVYSGMGAFFAIHTMNLAAGGNVWVPVVLIPLVGGLAGMCFGILFGYVTTRKSGTTFAMITLGIVELVFACSLMFPGFFGGEGGISTNRVYGESFWGITFGPQIQVYYLIAVWLFISTLGVYAFTQTPLGRIINAVRDNPERVEFIGYNTQWARYLTLILSGFFAGISGGLSAINFEIVTAENVSAARSGAILLFTFIGGTGYFCGPLIGAVAGVFLTVLLSDFTSAWQLYLGVFFIVMVMFAPGGIAGILATLAEIAAAGKLRFVAGLLCSATTGCAFVACGSVIVVEMLYRLTLETASGSYLSLFGVTTDITTATPWLIAFILIIAGTGVLWRVLPRTKSALEQARIGIADAASRGGQA